MQNSKAIIESANEYIEFCKGKLFWVVNVLPFEIKIKILLGKANVHMMIVPCLLCLKYMLQRESLKQ